MGPEEFGPYFWAALHMACLYSAPQLTREEKVQFENFITSYGYVLPCSICRDHFKEVLRENPIEWENLFAWSVKIHNVVSSTSKKGTTPQMAEGAARAKWSNPNGRQNLIKLVLVLLSILVLILFNKYIRVI